MPLKLSILILLCIHTSFWSCSEDSQNISETEKIKDNKKNEQKKKITSGFSDDLSSFIPKNYAILDTASGDLNLDAVEDKIVVLNKKGEDTLSNYGIHTEKRPLLILIRDKNNKLHLSKRNDNTVYCVDCGGVMGDPFTGITIKNGYFSIEHYGGSGWRWTRIITYKFEKDKNDWFLHKDGGVSFHASNPEDTKEIVKTKKEFGEIRFQDFNIYND